MVACTNKNIKMKKLKQKLKSKHIIYPLVLVFAILVPLMKYYSSTPKMNACVLDYVDNMEKSNYK